ncbi:MAG TPA: hypothetical protein VL051_03705 [Burkholderiaceae bacterium]|nr:hypothetical protein [Burkholderiaceae bacterium]
MPDLQKPIADDPKAARDAEEAAMMDGRSRSGAFLKVLLSPARIPTGVIRRRFHSRHGEVTACWPEYSRCERGGSRQAAHRQNARVYDAFIDLQEGVRR